MGFAEWRSVCVCGHDKEEHAYGKGVCVNTVPLGHCVRFISEADRAMKRHSFRQMDDCALARIAARSHAPRPDPTAELDEVTAP